MRCRDCPYGINDFSLRMSRYYYIVSEDGIPNDTFGDMQPDEYADEMEEFLWCDKVGGKVCYAGHCCDAYEEKVISHKSSKRKKRNKRERDLKYQLHLKKLYDDNHSKYPSPVIYTDKIWIKGQGYVENPKLYYQRLYRSKRSSYLKKQSNKKIRRYKGELHKGYQHIHKIYDFWYEYC